MKYFLNKFRIEGLIYRFHVMKVSGPQWTPVLLRRLHPKFEGGAWTAELLYLAREEWQRDVERDVLRGLASFTALEFFCSDCNLFLSFIISWLSSARELALGIKSVCLTILVLGLVVSFSWGFSKVEKLAAEIWRGIAIWSTAAF